MRARQFDSLLRSTSIVCIDNCFALTADGKYLVFLFLLLFCSYFYMYSYFYFCFCFFLILSIHLLSCASWDHVFKCSAVNTGRVHRVWRGLHSGMITCLALSSDGKTFATGSQDCSMLVWGGILCFISVSFLFSRFLVSRF